MKLSTILALVLLAVTIPMLLAQSAMPRMTAVDPATAKGGETLSVTGENLEGANVAEVFLTDGKNDLKCKIADQSATAMKVTVPGNVKPGRFALMLLTKGKEPKLIEQPVKVTIE